jgi:hypothetical protein
VLDKKIFRVNKKWRSEEESFCISFQPHLAFLEVLTKSRKTIELDPTALSEFLENTFRDSPVKRVMDV